MAALLNYSAIVDHDYAICACGCRQPVRDDERGALSGDPVAGRDHQRLRRRIERRGRLIEQQNVGVDQLGARQRDQLPLARGQAAPALADLLPEPARQHGDPR